MNTYQLKIKLKGTYITPFDADTIFGGICWTIRYLEGVDGLNRFLGRYLEGRPPLILSNAYPRDLLPRPMVPTRRQDFHTREEMLSSVQEAKRIKKIEFLTPDEFLSLIQSIPVRISSKEKPIYDVLTMHNQIGRHALSTSGSGELFEQVEHYVRPVGTDDRLDYDMSIYIKAEDDLAKKVPEFFTVLGQSGLGKRKSAGKGAFDVAGFAEYDRFDNIPGANAFISLSNFVPSTEDPVEGYYRVTVKYGKLGEEYALSENPFKRPLIMIASGSVFYAQPVCQYYGKLVRNIAPSCPDVVHYGYAFTVPARIA